MNTLNKIKKCSLISVVFVFIVGSIAHFIYEFSSYNTIVGYFTPINESVWEHLKLLFFPSVLFGILGYLFIEKDVNNYWLNIFVGTVIGTIFIVFAFYTYSGILGQSILIIDILIFLLASIIFGVTFYKLSINSFAFGYGNFLGIIMIGLMSYLFITYTYNPPNIPIFVSP